MKTNRYLFLVLGLFVRLLPPAAHADAYPMKHNTKDKPETVEPLAIHYVKSLLNARVHGAPLGQVLSQLGVATGARFTLIDPATEAQPVFAQVAALPFTEGVKRILDGLLVCDLSTRGESDAGGDGVVYAARPHTQGVSRHG